MLNTKARFYKKCAKIERRKYHQACWDRAKDQMRIKKMVGHYFALSHRFTEFKQLVMSMATVGGHK